MHHRFDFRCGLPLVLLFCVAFPCRAGETRSIASREAAGDSARFVTWTYKDAPMGLYLPAPTGKPLPVVMFLHGCNNDPVFREHWIISALNKLEPTVVFLPTAPATQNTQYPCADWGGTYDTKIRPQMQNALHELDSLIRLHSLDTTRQYLYGESMAGEGVYRLLVDFPTRFAGALDVAGYTPNKGAAQMARTPLWIWIGTEDEMSPIADARAIHEAILQAGGNLVKFTEVPDLGHVPAIEKARTDSSLLAWLLGQVRSPVSRIDRVRRGRSAMVVPLADGTLRLSDAVPAGARLTVFAMDGRTLLETGVEEEIVRLPSDQRDRVVFWRMSNPGFGLSGKLVLVP